MSKRHRYKRRGASSTTLTGGIFLGLLFLGLYYVNLSRGRPLESIVSLTRLPHSVWEIVAILAGSIALYAAIRLLFVSIRRSLRKQKLRMSGIYKIDHMSGAEFENYLNVFFEDLNYRVEDVGGKGDKGADKILIEPGTGKRICVQAKCWNNKNVTFEAVQQVFTAKSLWKCDEAWIITNRGFTKQVRETADQLQIDLWDRQRLIDNMYMYNMNKQKMAVSQASSFLASPESNVFHDLSCEHGRTLSKRQDALHFESYNLAVQSGRRKCNCYK